jgi:hypothetical protein
VQAFPNTSSQVKFLVHLLRNLSFTQSTHQDQCW